MPTKPFIRAAAVALATGCLTALAVLSANPATSLPPQRAGAPAGSRGGSPIAPADAGIVHGTQAGAVDSFLGIPYAAAPVGQRRWKPPEPASPWLGVRPAEHYGNACPATASAVGPRSETEDCLFVNVQRPAAASPTARLPVYFWIHGGGLVSGSSDQYDGAKIVAATGVVVVTINYRLGVFGFLSHPALTRESGESGNYGFEDQQAALRWVRRNIAGFGGDPHRVTIGGESAGGISVCAHLSAPGSRGLFAGAMIQSGSCASRSPAEAEASWRPTVSAVGCGDPATALPCLRGANTARLLDAAPSTPLVFVRDTPVLPDDPRVAVREGRFAHLPVVVGANRDEGRTFTLDMIGWTKDQYVEWVRRTFGPNADPVLARYPWPATADRFTPAYLTGAIVTDSGLTYELGGCPNRRLAQDLARFTPTYAYQFDHRTGPGPSAEPAGYVWGAGHGAELAYLWPSVGFGIPWAPVAPSFTPAERQLATEMVRYWGAFVRSGQPRVAGQPGWPAQDGDHQVLSLRAADQSRAISDATIVSQHRCRFWDALPTS